MNHFPRDQSQILGSVRASFIQGDDKQRMSIQQNAPIVPRTANNSVSSDEVKEVSSLKNWEIPRRQPKKLYKKISYVRLPGPKLKSEEEIEEANEDEYKSRELVNYLKDKWNLEIDKKSSLIDVNYRTVDMLTHEKPKNYWLMKRARQKIAEQTGLFSDVRKPYEPLGVPELDDAMLLFRNLPDTLRINPTEWIDVQLKKELAKLKESAAHPHIPRKRAQRVAYTRGRIKLDAGGIKVAERLIKTGEEFQREIRGTMTFTKLLLKWSESKEEETANRGSPFGLVKRSKVEAETESEKIPDLTGSSTPLHHVSNKSNEILGDGAEMDLFDGHHPPAAMDEKAYMEMSNLEQMITAIYHMLRSILNIRMRQLKGSSRIPHSGVMELRARSPDSKPAAPREAPIELVDKFNKNTNFYGALTRGLFGKPKSPQEEQEKYSDEGVDEIKDDFIIENVKVVEDIEEEHEDEEEIEEDCEEDDEMDEETQETSSTQIINKRCRPLENGLDKSVLELVPTFPKCLRTLPSKFEKTEVGEIYPLSSTGSVEDLKEAIERVKQIIDSPSYCDETPFELQSVKLKKEPAIPQAERNRRHAERFRLMFQRHEKRPEPIWHDVRLLDYDELPNHELGRTESSENLLGTGSNLEGQALSLDSMYSSRIPNPDGIITPNLPGARSLQELSSEEQSRLNLLAIAPEAVYENEELGSPLRKLYSDAGIKTVDKDLFSILMSIKRPFRLTEKSLRVDITNRAEKYDWDTLKRYKAKINATSYTPIYQEAMSDMRQLAKLARKVKKERTTGSSSSESEKKAAPWFRDLIEICDRIGALKHNGCKTMIHKLIKYCDVNTNTKQHMLKRFCLLVISLPGNELASPHFQKAILFLLDRLFGSPTQLLNQWLQYRGLKKII